jgi:hypothetical protein
MKGLRLAALMLTIFLALGVVSVYASGTGEGILSPPILSTSGAPALLSPSLFSGAISVIYADGTPVVLSTNHVILDLCNTSCVKVTATLTQTAPGAYTYSFTPPTSLTGTVTIYIEAYGLADDNGRMFPSIDTSVGTYAFAPSTTGTLQQPGTSVYPGTPPAPLTGQAVSTSQSQPTASSPVEALLLTLTALTVAGSLLVISKRY